MLATDLSATEVCSFPSTPGKASRPVGYVGLARHLNGGSFRTIGAKEHVYREGDPATHVYRVDAGHVCIYRLLPEGRRQIIDFAGPGDVIGLGALSHHAANAQATKKTRLTAFQMSALRETARHDVSLGQDLYEAVSQELQAAHDLLMMVSQRTAGERLAAFLLALCRRNRRRGEDAREIVLQMTRNDIADFLGLTIETVSRTFTRFRAEGLIDLEQCVLVTIRDPEGLERVVSGAATPKHENNLAA